MPDNLQSPTEPAPAVRSTEVPLTGSAGVSMAVVICAYTMNRWDMLLQSIDSVDAQTRAADELVVVIDHNDELLSALRAHRPQVRVVASDGEPGLSGARNTGVAGSTSDLVAFLDDDAIAEPAWLAEIEHSMRDARVAGVGGWIVPAFEGPSAPWFPQEYYWIVGCSYRGLPGAGESIRNPIGANMALRRSVFETVGGFTEGIGRTSSLPKGCEETELCIRYQAVAPDDTFVHATGAVVAHSVPAERTRWTYFWRRCWAEGLSKALVAKNVGQGPALASEYRYVTRVLPSGLLKALVAVRQEGRPAALRSLAIVAGVVLTGAGFTYGRFLTPAG